MKPTRLLMVMLTLFVATIMQAQQITCKGNIADVSGEPIIGASVVVKGTSQGTVSDLDGNFTINSEDYENSKISLHRCNGRGCPRFV